MRLLACLAMVAFLSACATATPINRGADQPSEYFIECNGDATPWPKCFAKANEACPRGYDILEQASDESPTGAAIGGAASFGVGIHRHLRVRCI